jgi:hypothetical protein
MTLTFFLRRGHRDADIGVARLIVQTIIVQTTGSVQDILDDTIDDWTDP